jgi:hypothetical protein
VTLVCATWFFYVFCLQQIHRFSVYLFCLILKTGQPEKFISKKILGNEPIRTWDYKIGSLTATEAALQSFKVRTFKNISCINQLWHVYDITHNTGDTKTQYTRIYGCFHATIDNTL